MQQNTPFEVQADSPLFHILQQANRHYRLDTANKRITFLDKRFYYTDEGKPLPSVTTILEAFPKGYGFYEWLKKNGEDSDEIRDEAGRRGSVVHGLTEDYDRGKKVSLLTESGEIGINTLEWSMFERYVQFRKANPQLKVIEIEQNLVYELGGYGGTKDRIFDLPGFGRMLLDIKTANNLHDHYWCQLAAYKTAHNEMLLAADPTGKLLKEKYVDTVGVLWLNAKTRTEKSMKEGQITDCQGRGWQLVTRSAADQRHDWDIFQATHKLWLVQNDGVIPKEVSYALEYQDISDEIKQQMAADEAVKKANNGTSPSSVKSK